ncbi:MAG: M20/M25/M40 family metallo-hydrolase, partial [Solirubrobacterales bacterium]|nr:M20/M25/M40 family metallo-hydrolase [Solirubrobacterales bacterium]
VNLVARLHAERPVGKPILLSSHMDVVQANAADWTFDPYSGEVADGYIYGRGTLDMKGMGSSSTRAARGCAASSAPATSSRCRSARNAADWSVRPIGCELSIFT